MDQNMLTNCSQGQVWFLPYELPSLSTTHMYKKHNKLYAKTSSIFRLMSKSTVHCQKNKSTNKRNFTNRSISS